MAESSNCASYIFPVFLTGHAMGASVKKTASYKGIRAFKTPGNERGGKLCKEVRSTWSPWCRTTSEVGVPRHRRGLQPLPPSGDFRVSGLCALLPRRLAGSVAAPPETGNIVDVVAHQSAFPAYHFLPYPSMEELQNSRLAALAAKPYADICFPPEVTARVVHLRRDAAYLPTPSFNTSLISDDAWRNGDSREVFYELKFTCATPCCSFWFAIADGQWSASQPLPREYPVRQLSSFKPLLVPGPFPKTVRVQCRKPGKNHSRFTQTCLKLKGAAAAWTSLPAGASPMGQRRCATSGQAGPGSSVSTTEVSMWHSSIGPISLRPTGTAESSGAVSV